MNNSIKYFFFFFFLCRPNYPSNPQAFSMSYMNGSIPTGSVPSIKTSSSSPTPQPDDSLLMQKRNNYINHQKTNSDASSTFTKRGNTPSTTASSSPAPAIMKAIYEEQLRAESRMRENGRSSFSTSIISEEIPNFIRQQGGQENSQTESENVHTQMQNELPYRPPSHLSQGSQGSNIPSLYRVGKSTSNTSVPSSIQSSHLSLDNRGPYQFHLTNPGLPYHQVVRAGAPRAEVSSILYSVALVWSQACYLMSLHSLFQLPNSTHTDPLILTMACAW